MSIKAKKAIFYLIAFSILTIMVFLVYHFNELGKEALDSFLSVDSSGNSIGNENFSLYRDVQGTLKKLEDVSFFYYTVINLSFMIFIVKMKEDFSLAVKIDKYIVLFFILNVLLVITVFTYYYTLRTQYANGLDTYYSYRTLSLGFRPIMVLLLIFGMFLKRFEFMDFKKQ